jgi:hypothetical protein
LAQYDTSKQSEAAIQHETAIRYETAIQHETATQHEAATQYQELHQHGAPTIKSTMASSPEVQDSATEIAEAHASSIASPTETGEHSCRQINRTVSSCDKTPHVEALLANIRSLHDIVSPV